MKPSPYSTSDSGASSSAISVSEDLLETIERRAPFAQSEFVYNVTTGASFEIPYSFLTPANTDTVYAQVINAQADLRIWRDPSVTQIPGVLRLSGNTTTVADFLLFIPRP